jgi:hypothetical protein
MPNTKLYQHGDVLIELIEKIPENAKKQEKTAMGAVLAEGEATGHFHRTMDAGVDMFESGDQLFMSVDNSEKGSCIITHDEHNPIEIPNGDYEIRKVREYDHFVEEARAVQD